MWIILSAFGISYNYLIKVARYKLIDLSWGQKINEEMDIRSLFPPFAILHNCRLLSHLPSYFDSQCCKHCGPRSDYSILSYLT